MVIKQILRKIFLIALPVFFIGGFVAHNRTFMIHNRAFVAQNNFFSEYKCDIPVTYAIGAVDPRFGISQEKFETLMREAEQKWETALGRDVFRFETDGRVKVNLTYDERQMTTEYLQKINATIEAGKQKTDKFVDSYEALTAQLEQKKNIFNTDTKKFEKIKKNYEDDVDQYQENLQIYEQRALRWNTQGSESGDDYEKIIKQKKTLDKQYEDIEKQKNVLKNDYDNLEKKRKEINALVAKINSLANMTNKIAGKTNEDVVNYNQTQAERGEFETGLYTNNDGIESIDIFQFADEQDLLAVLIHEMGHSLGMAHAQNSNAIMYPKLINQTSDITADDIALFQTACIR